MSNNPVAYYNSSKLCWEILIEQARGDRYELVPTHADVAHRMLKEQNIKFIDAMINQQHHPMMLICDHVFWVLNEKQILDWCTESNVYCKRTGMLIEFNSQEDKMMFILRWQ